MVRTLVVAPANMHPDPIRGNIAQRVVEHVDMFADQCEIVGVRPVLVHHVAPEAEIGAVELQDKPGFGDGFIFRAHRLGECFEIVVLARVIFVRLEKGDDAGRRSVHEGKVRFVCREHALQTRDVCVERLAGQRRDGTDASGAPIRRGPPAFCLAREEIGEGLEVGRWVARTVAVKPADAILDIGGVADLQHFAIGDDVDSGGDLPANSVVDGGIEFGGEAVLVDGLAAFGGE